MPPDNHLPSADLLLLSLQCETPTRQIVEAEQDSGQPLRDEYCSSPAAQYYASDSMPPMCGFSSPTPLNLGRISSVQFRISLIVTYKNMLRVWDPIESIQGSISTRTRFSTAILTR